MTTDQGAADPALRSTLASLARGWRERALLTQEQLAERSGLGLRTVRRLEAGGERRLRGRSILLLADALGLSADERARMTEAAGGGRSLPVRPDPVTCRLAAALEDQSLRLADLGRPEEALAAIEEAVALYRALVDASPDEVTCRLAAALRDQSLRLADLGRPEEALAAIEEAVALYRALAPPANPSDRPPR